MFFCWQQILFGKGHHKRDVEFQWDRVWGHCWWLKIMAVWWLFCGCQLLSTFGGSLSAGEEVTDLKKAALTSSWSLFLIKSRAAWNAWNYCTLGPLNKWKILNSDELCFSLWNPNSNFQHLLWKKVTTFFSFFQFEYLLQNYFLLISPPLSAVSCYPKTITQNISDAWNLICNSHSGLVLRSVI